MKKQRGFKKWALNGPIMLLLAVVLAISGMSSIAMAAAGDVLVSDGSPAPAGSTIITTIHSDGTSTTMTNDAGSGNNNGIVGVGNVLGDGNIRTVIGNINYDTSIMTGLEANDHHVTVGSSLASGGDYIAGLSADETHVEVGARNSSTNVLYGLNADTTGNVAIQGTTNNIIGATNINTTGAAATIIGSATSATTVDGTLNVTGTTILHDNLGVGGNTRLRGTLGVQGATTTNGITNTGNIQTETLHVTGDTTVGGKTSFNGPMNMNGNTITGVADGKNQYDAVNFGQLQKANAGIASVSALAAIPGAMPGKRFAIGAGYGYFENESAIAIGIKAAIGNSISISVGGGLGVGGGSSSSTVWTGNAGISYSF